MSKITKENEVLIKAKVLDHLIEHLQKRTDVQNIDLMNLSGFCRNCLSKWYAKYANEAGYDLDYEETRKIISVCLIQIGKKNFKKKLHQNNYKNLKINNIKK